jgi:hypothetical protein
MIFVADLAAELLVKEWKRVLKEARDKERERLRIELLGKEEG